MNNQSAQMDTLQYAEQDANYPWQNVEDRTQVFNLRLPASYAAKLDYLVKGTMPKRSKQLYLLERILPLLDEELKKRDLPV